MRGHSYDDSTYSADDSLHFSFVSFSDSSTHLSFSHVMSVLNLLDVYIDLFFPFLLFFILL